MPHLVRLLLLSTSALALAACGGSIQKALFVAPSELPDLGKTTTGEIKNLPSVKTADGATAKLHGKITITNVEMLMKRQWVPVDVPFTARISADQLQISTDRLRTYPVADISYVGVQYEYAGEPGSGEYNAKRSKARARTGFGLALGSFFPIGLGAIVLGAGSDCSSGFSDLCNGFAAGGALLAIGGTAMLITGISLMSSNPAPRPSNAMKIRPTLRLSPTAGSLSFEF